MQEAQSVTSLGISPDEERKRRMIKYTIAMSVRVVCILLAMVVQGWLMWVLFAAAIVLPYFAVVLANVQGPSSKSNSTPNAVAPKLSISADAFRETKSKQ